MTTENSGGVSRRAFVTGVATAAAGVGVAAATAGTAQAADSGGGSWAWHGSEWRMVRPSAAGKAPDRHAPASTEGIVSDGSRSGSFRSVPLGGGAHLHLFTFDDDVLLGLGRGLSNGAYAIVGGTGRFAGLAGAYIAQQTPATPGNEGSALFTITPTR